MPLQSEQDITRPTEDDPAQGNLLFVDRAFVPLPRSVFGISQSQGGAYDEEPEESMRVVHVDPVAAAARAELMRLVCKAPQEDISNVAQEQEQTTSRRLTRRSTRMGT